MKKMISLFMTRLVFFGYVLCFEIGRFLLHDPSFYPLKGSNLIIYVIEIILILMGRVLILLLDIRMFVETKDNLKKKTYVAFAVISGVLSLLMVVTVSNSIIVRTGLYRTVFVGETGNFWGTEKLLFYTSLFLLLVEKIFLVFYASKKNCEKKEEKKSCASITLIVMGACRTIFFYVFLMIPVLMSFLIDSWKYDAVHILLVVLLRLFVALTGVMSFLSLRHSVPQKSCLVFSLILNLLETGFVVLYVLTAVLGFHKGEVIGLTISLVTMSFLIIEAAVIISISIRDFKKDKRTVLCLDGLD
ncbi:MAG: hypothetical protein IJK34_08945 [Clostridia bacterium]|nr:hypothetical protein [Clostridia bacterium]